MRRTTGVLAALLTTGSVLAGCPPSAYAVDGDEPACTTPPEPVDPIADLPWAQSNFDPVRQVWPFSLGIGIQVAVLDSGVDGTHPQLRDQVLPGFDLVRNVPQGDVDCVPHGTAVASIIAARQQSGVGFAGLAPRAVILPVRITTTQKTGPTSEPLSTAALAGGIDFALRNGADVINVSAVVYENDPAVAAAVGRAVAAGVVVVAAVGNGHDEQRDGLGPTNSELTPYPAAYPGVIGVGAVDISGRRAAGSQIGGYVDLVAPGADVVAAGVVGHNVYSGTSFATAFVSATAALLLGQRPSRLPRDGPVRAAALTTQLLSTASPVAGDRLAYGAGIVDPYRALSEPPTADFPLPLEGRTPPEPDLAALALSAERQADDRSALLAGAALGGLGVLLVVGAVFLPRGRRRGWRAGRELTVTGPDAQAEFLPGEALYGPPRRGP